MIWVKGFISCATCLFFRAASLAYAHSEDTRLPSRPCKYAARCLSKALRFLFDKTSSQQCTKSMLVLRTPASLLYSIPVEITSRNYGFLLQLACAACKWPYGMHGLVFIHRNEHRRLGHVHCSICICIEILLIPVQVQSLSLMVRLHGPTVQAQPF